MEWASSSPICDDVSWSIAAAYLADALLDLYVHEFFPSQIIANHDGNPRDALRLSLRKRTARWIPQTRLIHVRDYPPGEASRYATPPVPFGVFLGARRRKGWGEETAALVSLAQMRSCAGSTEVLVLSLRGSKMWVVAALVDRRWLDELQEAPKKKVQRELQVTVRGGWDLKTEEGRAQYWEGLGVELERMAGPPAPT